MKKDFSFSLIPLLIILYSIIIRYLSSVDLFIDFFFFLMISLMN